MEKLVKYLRYIRENKLEAFLDECLDHFKRHQFPQINLELSDKNLQDLFNKQLSLLLKRDKEGILAEKGEAFAEPDLDLMEEETFPGPEEHAFLLFIQRHSLQKFVPDYTQDLQTALQIMDELEELHLRDVMLVWEKRNKAAMEKENELKQSNLFLNAILENIPNMIFVKDAEELRFVRLNKAGEDLLGYDRSELIGKNDYNFFPKDQADFFIKSDHKVLGKKKPLDVPAEIIQTRYKGLRWLHTQKIPICSPEGKPLYLVGISEDITERKEQEDAIHQLNKDMESFSYSVSHDLRAPLRAINGYARILEEEYSPTLPEEAGRLVSVILSNSEKMGQLIDELLTFSRLGRKELQKNKVSMNEIVEGVILDFEKSTRHDARIVVDPLPVVEVDYGLIHQVMINLLSNAVKYSSKKEKPEIYISWKEQGKDQVFSVKDNGVGFNMKYAGKLFGVFQRLHSSEEYEGMGVGLAIVHRIITRHGGRVWAEGKEKEGATFYFTLPTPKTISKSPPPIHQS